MTELHINNPVGWTGDGLVVPLGLDITTDSLAEPLRRLLGAGVIPTGVRADGHELAFDPTETTAHWVRRVREAGLRPPFEILAKDAPGLSDVARCAGKRDINPLDAASPVRRSDFLMEKLTGRGFKAEAARDGDGSWSFTARSRPQTGRPSCLRQHLDHPRDGSEYLEDDSIEAWGFKLGLSTWRSSAPAYDNVWLHPSGVVVHLRCRPTKQHSQSKHSRRYTLAVDGLWAGTSPSPLVASTPDAAELRDAVLDGVAAWVRFGPIR